ERVALQRLIGEHGTREDELDDLLRGEVFVDLYRVTRQALRLALGSYSIKKVEEFYAFERTEDIGGGGGATVMFEEWIEAGDPSILESIRAYNEEDCRSLFELHRWLLELRPKDIPWRSAPEGSRPPPPHARERLGERARTEHGRLEGATEGEPRWLLAQLLEYHRREEKPQWWEYFHHRSLDEEELVTDSDTIGDITAVGEPEEDDQS